MESQRKKLTSSDRFNYRIWKKLFEDWREAAQAKKTNELEEEIYDTVKNASNLLKNMIKVQLERFVE